MALAARWIRMEQYDCASLRKTFAGFARAQNPRAAPTVFWAQDDAGRIAFALVVPMRLAPGRPWRWRSWALAPSIATYRRFGARAYLDSDDVWLGGRRIATSESAAVGDCAVIASSFLARLPRSCPDWTERNVAVAFRGCIEAQHGWQFDHSWPSAQERAAINGALAVEATGAE